MSDSFVKPMPKNKYLQQRVEAMLGKYYTLIEIDGTERFVSAKTPYKEREAIFSEFIEDSLKYLNTIFIEIDRLTKRVRAIHTGDMGGEIGGVPFSELFYSTPFRDLKIYEGINGYLR